MRGPPHTRTRKNEDFWPFTDAEVKGEMAKRLLGGAGMQPANQPVRRDPVALARICNAECRARHSSSHVVIVDGSSSHVVIVDSGRCS